MSNCSYLCCSDEPHIYPSWQDEGYDAAARTVASGSNCIPLLWLGLFRPRDVKEHSIQIRQDTGERQKGLTRPTELVSILFRAPVVEKAKAPSRLEAALSHFLCAFPDLGPLDGHVALLASCIDSAPGRYITMEIDEIVEPEDDAAWSSFMRALSFFDTPLSEHTAPTTREGLLGRIFGRSRDPIARARKSILRLTELESVSTAPELSPDDSEADDEYWIATNRILGQSLHRPVPWEPSDA